MLNKIQQGLKNDLIAGLLVVIPLATTIWLTITVATWVIGALTRFPTRLTPFDDFHPALVALFNLGIGLAVPLMAILLIGLMARNIAGRWLLDFGERILQSIPLAGSVYKTLKQLLESILQDTKSKFSSVVLVEYPRRGVWAIAFVTSSVTSMNPDTNMLSVFVPTTPNPTSGWYAVVPEADVVNLTISIEEAFKVLLSGGIVGPNLAEALVENDAQKLQLTTENNEQMSELPVSSDMPPPESPETRVELVNIDQSAN